jgi:hypothetical protein
MISENVTHAILKRAVDVRDPHFHFVGYHNGDTLKIPACLVRNFLEGGCLLSMATNITIRDHQGGYLSLKFRAFPSHFYEHWLWLTATTPGGFSGVCKHLAYQI